ncbi:hypothetical protein [Chitinophaga defluvii]|uniref:Peptidase C25-like protein n=1 Tax=Chitinophaga defluvii TaxID=3163343 RepID=A0ABV2T5N2_9BACT
MENAIKLILTNKTALEKKYGSKHKSILAALESLREFDKTRRLDTRIIFLDDAALMKKCKAKAVTDTLDAKQNKQAVDALYKHFSPGYILLVGAQDIIPFQRLDNLLFSEDDEDKYIPSDLPYACDVPYNTKPGKFIAPARVVGRLPDVPGQNDPAYLLSLLKDSMAVKPVARKNYHAYFSVSVFDWQKSTEQSLQNIFGGFKSLQLSPGKGKVAKWTLSQMKPKVHFYNCHGALDDAAYYGQKGNDYPIALQSDALTKKVTFGTVVAAECCYGAQLFDPKVSDGHLLSIANNYLLNHAVAFTGSSTIAYGPPQGQGLADLLTQYFLINVINGASTGRALLEARQRFLNEMGPTLDPYELKTAAQFYLLGDPSLVLVENETDPNHLAKSKSFVNTLQNRRDNMEAKSKALQGYISTPEKVDDGQGSTTLKKEIKTLLQERNFDTPAPAKVFVNEGKSSGTRDAKSFRPTVKFHVYSESAGEGKLKKTKVLVVKEKNNQILGFREYVRK